MWTASSRYRSRTEQAGLIQLPVPQGTGGVIVSALLNAPPTREARCVSGLSLIETGPQSPYLRRSSLLKRSSLLPVHSRECLPAATALAPICLTSNVLTCNVLITYGLASIEWDQG